MTDLYRELELTREASAEEIKASYRRLAMRWHPDRNQGSPEAEDRFKAISQAYAVLSDEQSRRDYDQRLAAFESGPAEGQESFGLDEAFAEAFRRAFAGAFAREGFGGSGFAQDGFSREDAADLFTRSMYELATELTMQNVGWRDIARELVQRGCPESTAAEIASEMERRRKAMIRGNARPYLMRSALSGGFGLILLALFGGLGFGIVGLIGLVMSLNGAYNLVRALYFMTTGAAPRRLV
jgi:curved DNA-binding protein CbpA